MDTKQLKQPHSTGNQVVTKLFKTLHKKPAKTLETPVETLGQNQDSPAKASSKVKTRDC